MKDSESETAETALLDDETEDDAILEDDTIAMVDFDGDFPNESSSLLAAQRYSKYALAPVHRDVSLAGSRVGANAGLAMSQGPAMSRPSAVSSSGRATIRSSWKPLLQMMRIGNFPGVFVFHLMGIHRALAALNQPASLSHCLSLFFKPSMLITLFSILLITASSMIVNDYYDARNGVDALKAKLRNVNTNGSNRNTAAPGTTYGNHNLGNNNPVVQHRLSDVRTSAGSVFTPPTQAHSPSIPTSFGHKSSTSSILSDKPLASGVVSLPVAKRFLSYMYATLLLSVTFVPGTPARLSIVTGAMTTFWYTQHLKPKTWLKNVSCALLMALSPLTSGAAVMHLEALSVAAATGVKRTIWDLVGSKTVALGPLFLALFCGFMGREIFMDVKDYQGDKKAGIETVPVRYGRRFGTAVGFGFYGMMGLVAIMGPLLDLLLGNGVASLEGMGLLQLLQIPVLQRLFSGSLAGIIMCFRANQIYRTEGRDETVLNKAIEEGKFTSLLVLASFLKF